MIGLGPGVNLPPGRLLGEGYEPHVDAMDGRLSYSLPVDAGFVTTSFAFDIAPADLDILLADPYRRAMLAATAHTVLQRSMIPGRPEVSRADFDELKRRVLYSDREALEAFADEIDREYNIAIRAIVGPEVARYRARGGAF